MSASEAELRRAVANLEVLRAQIESLGRQEEILHATHEDVLRARETLARARDAGVGAEVLMPIGANSFVFGDLKDTERVIVGIGSDVAVDLPIPQAIERLEARAKALEEAERGLAARMAELDAVAQQQSRVVQDLYDKAQGGPG